jgi:hypothetical protein
MKQSNARSREGGGLVDPGMEHVETTSPNPSSGRQAPRSQLSRKGLARKVTAAGNHPPQTEFPTGRSFALVRAAVAAGPPAIAAAISAGSTHRGKTSTGEESRR